MKIDGQKITIGQLECGHRAPGNQSNPDDSDDPAEEGYQSPEHSPWRDAIVQLGTSPRKEPQEQQRAGRETCPVLRRRKQSERVEDVGCRRNQVIRDWP